MGKYIDPPERVIEVGRKIFPVMGNSHSDYIRLLHGDEILYALCDRGIFKFAACVDKTSEFEHLGEQYNSGMLLKMDFYAVKRKDVG